MEEFAMKKVKISNKRRFVTFLVFIFVLISISISSLLNINTVSGKELENHKYVTVKKGDTLWDIASEHMEGKDIRKGVYILRKYNKLQDAVIYPGQQIKVPTN
jgi:LysM repeat protein